MAFGISSGQLGQVTSGPTPQPATSPSQVAVPGIGNMATSAEYAQLWRSQPNVRTMAGFLARNVAQLGLHVFRRVSDTERRREHDHAASWLLDQPMEGLTSYRLVERIVSDLAVFDQTFLLKGTGEDGLELLVPVPAHWVQVLGTSSLAPTGYRIPAPSGSLDLSPRDVVAIHGYDPEDMRVGSSPIEALRSMLSEEDEATRFRQRMWRNGAHMSGVITRPVEAPDWSKQARERFVESWRAYQRDGGRSGGTPLLEDGMQYHPAAFNPQQAQYLEARKLTREEVAAAYYIPPPLVGIMEASNYSNVREMHKQLYQDTLGPILRVIEQEIRSQVLADLNDHDGLYVEFNVDDKLKGSFEEQAQALQTAVGRPWMTAAEARALRNLPPIDGADQLVTPLNVMLGDQASPTDTDPTEEPPGKLRDPGHTAALDDGGDGELGTRDSERDVFADRLSRLLHREAERLSGVLTHPGTVDALDALRTDELTATVAGTAHRLARVGAGVVLDRHNPTRDGWSADAMWGWVRKAAGSHVDGITHSLGKLLRDAARAADWPAARDAALSRWAGRAGMWATTITTECVSFGGADAAWVCGLSVKTWRAGDRRHQPLDGETVDIDQVFSNGLRWPADPVGHGDDTAGCVCSVTYMNSQAQ